MTQTNVLHVRDHSRDVAGLRYVYPVVSRRAEGVSIGINLNPNNACNWRCVYCQVPNLVRGSAPAIDHDLLEEELRSFLDDALRFDFYERYGVENAYRKLRDIAISGNGEPTSAGDFALIVERIGRVMKDYDLINNLNLVLISNGSLAHHTQVQRGLTKIHELGGEVWFKVDSATDSGLQRINHAATSARRLHENLRICAKLCRTWVQTCVFAFDGLDPSRQECDAYMNLLASAANEMNHFKGVLVYGLARESQQAEKDRLGQVSAEWLQHFVTELKRLPIEIRIHA